MMELVPPVGWADVATTRDLDHLRTDLRAELAELRAEMERLARRVVMWTSTMVIAMTGLSFGAARLV